MAPLVCHLCSFNPEVAGTFLDAVLHLTEAASEQLGADTVFVFPQAAAERSWLSRLDTLATPYLCSQPHGVPTALAQWLDRKDPVILHSHFVRYDLTAFRVRLTRPKQVRTLIHLHSEAMKSQPIKDLLKIRLLARWLADFYVAVSDNVADSQRPRGIPASRMTVVPNAVRLDRFVRSAEARCQARSRLGLADHETAILLLGWDPLRKGVDVLLDAVDEVVKRSCNPAAVLVVGQDQTVRFIVNHPSPSTQGGLIRILEPVEDFAELLNGIDVFVSASRSEGLPYALLEAMATERMVIASAIAGADSSYGRAEGVWLFPADNAHALAALLERALATEAVERRQIGRDNRAFVESNFSLDLWTKRMIGIYRALIVR